MTQQDVPLQTQRRSSSWITKTLSLVLVSFTILTAIGKRSSLTSSIALRQGETPTDPKSNHLRDNTHIKSTEDITFVMSTRHKTYGKDWTKPSTSNDSYEVDSTTKSESVSIPNNLSNESSTQSDLASIPNNFSNESLSAESNQPDQATSIDGGSNNGTTASISTLSLETRVDGGDQVDENARSQDSMEQKTETIMPGSFQSFSEENDLSATQGNEDAIEMNETVSKDDNLSTGNNKGGAIETIANTEKGGQEDINGSEDSTDQPFSEESGSSFDGVDKEYELPFMVYGSLQYRRVCAPAGLSSVVCMTIRYPWEVALQDATFSYPRPVDDRFYGLEEKSLIIVDGTTLDECKKETADHPFDEAVKNCLDVVAASRTAPTVVVIFFRERNDSMTLFGTGSGQQLENILDFFDGQVVQVFGDSTAPGVTSCLQGAFGGCSRSPVEAKVGSFYCGGRKKTTENATERSLAWTDMDESYNIFLGMADYYCPDIRSDASHVLPKVSLTEWIAQKGMARNPGWTELRGLTLVIQYPLAHIQSQDMILNRWDTVENMQKEFPRLIMSVLTEQGRSSLAELGWELKNVIVFDGFPQFFPTVTSAYFGPTGTAINSEEDFVARGGYEEKGASPAWSPEYGHACRGPVPPNSIMTNVSRISRKSFEDLGLDMRFYVRNWEFSNHFWWMTHNWNGKHGQLDCTHGGGGFYCMHKYLLQATIDDYYDNFDS